MQKRGYAMTIDEAVEYFGTMYRLCVSLDVAHSNMQHWKKNGYIPHFHQLRIEQYTDGALKADEVDPVIVRKFERLKARQEKKAASKKKIKNVEENNNG